MPDNDGAITEEPSRDIGALIRLIITGLLGLLLLAFAIDNRATVRVGWVFGEGRAPMVVVLLIAAVIGALIGWLVHYRAKRAGRRNRSDQDD